MRGVWSIAHRLVPLLIEISNGLRVSTCGKQASKLTSDLCVLNCMFGADCVGRVSVIRVPIELRRFAYV